MKTINKSRAEGHNYRKSGASHHRNRNWIEKERWLNRNPGWFTSFFKKNPFNYSNEPDVNPRKSTALVPIQRREVTQIHASRCGVGLFFKRFGNKGGRSDAAWKDVNKCIIRTALQSVGGKIYKLYDPSNTYNCNCSRNCPGLPFNFWCFAVGVAVLSHCQLYIRLSFWSP